MLTLAHAFIHDRRGTTPIEFSMIALLMGVALIGVFQTLGGDVSAMFGTTIAGNVTVALR